MSTVNHWGIWVNSEEPITGVLSVHSVNWEYMDYGICLDCESIIEEIESDESLDEDGRQDELDSVECDSSHVKLYGDWIQDDNGQYAPDKNKEFAAIGHESELQIIWSTAVTRGALCSPCFPGQCDLDSEGEFMAYTLPDDLIRKD
jgi:hypothetical protein